MGIETELEINGVKNGMSVKDQITGFEGIVTGIVVYITGCHQACVTASAKKDKMEVHSMYIDIQRLKVQKKGKQIILKNEETPGFGETPPVR